MCEMFFSPFFLPTHHRLSSHTNMLSCIFNIIIIVNLVNDHYPSMKQMHFPPECRVQARSSNLQESYSTEFSHANRAGWHSSSLTLSSPSRSRVPSASLTVSYSTITDGATEAICQLPSDGTYWHHNHQSKIKKIVISEFLTTPDVGKSRFPTYRQGDNAPQLPHDRFGKVFPEWFRVTCSFLEFCWGPNQSPFSPSGITLSWHLAMWSTQSIPNGQHWQKAIMNCSDNIAQYVAKGSKL